MSGMGEMLHYLSRSEMGLEAITSTSTLKRSPFAFVRVESSVKRLLEALRGSERVTPLPTLRDLIKVYLIFSDTDNGVSSEYVRFSGARLVSGKVNLSGWRFYLFESLKNNAEAARMLPQASWQLPCARFVAGLQWGTGGEERYCSRLRPRQYPYKAVCRSEEKLFVLGTTLFLAVGDKDATDAGMDSAY